LAGKYKGRHDSPVVRKMNKLGFQLRGEVMEGIQEYFARSETPAAGSPVGALFVRIINKNPGMSFEEARTEANALLDKAAGRKVYRLPRVLSPDEQLEQKARMRAKFNPLLKAA
jgi:hypothetical protein